MKAYKKPKENLREPSEGIGRSGLATSELLLHSSTHPKLDYVAREESSGTDNQLKHYVGVYDPKTGECQLVEARKLVLRSSLRPTKSVEDTEGEKEDTHGVCHNIPGIFKQSGH